MKGETKKRIAREWLYLLAFVLGAVVLLMLSAAIRGKNPLGFFPEYLGGRGQFIVWISTLTPYFVFLFFRSIVWAVKAVRS